MQYTDIAIERFLRGTRVKGGFLDFAKKECDYDWDGAPTTKLAILSEYLKAHPIEHTDILDLEMQLLPILARMEMQGVLLDTKKLEDIGVRLDRDMKRLEAEIYDLTNERFNLNSPKQVQQILFEKLKIPTKKKNKTGFSVDNEVLEEIAHEYDIARLILEYRSHAKLRSTYVDGLLKIVDKKTKRVHTNYNQMGTSTGRISSENPNLQNIPAGEGYAAEIKACFIPSTSGNTLMTADYSQIELRVLAFLSGDTKLIEAFQNGRDVHNETAKFLFGDVTITKEMRRIAKTVNFGVIYGITGFGLSKTLGTSPFEANSYIEKFYGQYTGVRAYYDALLEKARETGYVETYFGRKRYIKGLSDANKMMRAAAEREAMNMPIQGTAADIIKYAMIALDRQISSRELSGKMILQVHDELVFDIPHGEMDVFSALVKDTMENVISDISVPIVVDISHGENWSVAK